MTARGPRQHRGGSGRRTHGRASRWPHPTSAKVRFGATTPQPQLPEAVRHCAAVCCRRAAAVAAVQAVAAEAKTRHNWRSVMTQIATEYVADPHKYGDGSGTLKSWIEGTQNLHPSGFPAGQYTHLTAAVRKWRQTLTANALSAGSAAGGAAGSVSAPSRVARRAHAMDEPIAEDEPTPVGGLTPHPDSPVKSATEVKDGDYRAAWKWCLAEMRKELANRTRCRDGYGPAVIVQRARSRACGTS